MPSIGIVDEASVWQHKTDSTVKVEETGFGDARTRFGPPPPHVVTPTLIVRGEDDPHELFEVIVKECMPAPYAVTRSLVQ